MANWFENVSQMFTGDRQWRRFTLRRIATIIAGMMVVAGVLLVPGADSTAQAQTASAFTNLRSSDFNVYANQGPPGLDAGINVVPDTHITITAHQLASYGPEGQPGCVGYPLTDPDGRRFLPHKQCPPKIDPNGILPYAPIGELIGEIVSANGTSSTGWFAIGKTFSQTFYISGRLFLLYNDSHNQYGNNSGSYDLTLTSYIIRN